MREYKYRAWDKEEKKMIYKMTPLLLGFLLQDKTLLYTMQFIECLDTHKKEIYEKDIINLGKREKGKPSLIGIVEWNNKDASYNIVDSEGNWLENLAFSEKWHSVIGNLYEHPQLFKKE